MRLLLDEEESTNRIKSNQTKRKCVPPELWVQSNIPNIHVGWPFASFHFVFILFGLIKLRCTYSIYAVILIRINNNLYFCFVPIVFFYSFFVDSMAFVRIVPYLFRTVFAHQKYFVVHVLRLDSNRFAVHLLCAWCPIDRDDDALVRNDRFSFFCLRWLLAPWLFQLHCHSPIRRPLLQAHQSLPSKRHNDPLWKNDKLVHLKMDPRPLTTWKPLRHTDMGTVSIWPVFQWKPLWHVFWTCYRYYHHYYPYRPYYGYYGYPYGYGGYYGKCARLPLHSHHRLESNFGCRLILFPGYPYHRPYYYPYYYY